MKDIFKQLLDSKIDWEESPKTKYLQARFNDKVARLRFNDWPDHWTLPAHRKKQQSENVQR
jgi:hypothetical protein